jgi:hypothetical protein
MRKGGVLLAGFNNPVVHLIDYDHFAKSGHIEVRYALPYSDLESLSAEERKHREREGIPLEFGHTLEDQIGGQIRAGFVITGLHEDPDRDNSDCPLKTFTATYIATRALKPT